MKCFEGASVSCTVVGTRDSFNGRTSVFQTENAGSIPASRTSQRKTAPGGGFSLGKHALLQCILESLGGTELGDTHRLDLDGGTRARIAASAASARLCLEDAEASYRDLFAPLEENGYLIDHCFDGTLGICLRAPDRGRDLLDKIHLICHIVETSA